MENDSVNQGKTQVPKSNTLSNLGDSLLKASNFVARGSGINDALGRLMHLGAVVDEQFGNLSKKDKEVDLNKIGKAALSTVIFPLKDGLDIANSIISGGQALYDMTQNDKSFGENYNQNFDRNEKDVYPIISSWGEGPTALEWGSDRYDAYSSSSTISKPQLMSPHTNMYMRWQEKPSNTINTAQNDPNLPQAIDAYNTDQNISVLQENQSSPMIAMNMQTRGGDVSVLGNGGFVNIGGSQTQIPNNQFKEYMSNPNNM